MAMKQEFVQQIGAYGGLISQFYRIVGESNSLPLTSEAQRIIDAIPFIIAERSFLEENYAFIMDLTEGDDFVIPTRKDRFLGKLPKADWLIDTAAQVFQYCHNEGLSPQLENYMKERRLLTSRISIEWQPEALKAKLEKQTQEAPTFLEMLTQRANNSNSPNTIVARSRLSGALVAIPHILRLVMEAADRGEHSIEHVRDSSQQTEEAADQRIADITAFLNLLNLNVKVVETQGWVSRVPCKTYIFTISGW